MDLTTETLAGSWKKEDIICLALIGPLVIAAFLEAFLWVAAICYCLGKAFTKADHWTQKSLAAIVTVAFMIIRGIFLPTMAATLPLPRRITQYFPHDMMMFLQRFGFYTFALMLTLPWLFALYRLVVMPLGRKKLLRYQLTERTAPKVVVVMPIYKEPPESLWTALRSVVECDYPGACLHVFMSFDGEEIDELYLKTIDRLGIPVTLKEFPRSIDVVFQGVRVTVSRFQHGGKRHTQKATFLLIDKIYKRYLQRKDDLFILFIDSDCILDPVCIQNFMFEMELKPGNKHTMLAMTGIITACSKKNSFLTIMQDMEYLHGQLYERSIESGCGAVTCLPGALTLLRFSAFRNMARFYFSDRAEECEDLFDYAKTHLGEDRWLTHLFMLGAKERYQIQLSTTAFCKTEAVQTYRALLKQRRRWFLGFITNEVCMLTDPRLWRKYPFLCLLRFCTVTIRTTAMLFAVAVISLATTSSDVRRLPWEFMCISCGLNWLFMFYYAIRLHRWKSLFFPVMFFINPFFSWWYMTYAVFTAGQRTWGGPRADAGAADAKISPQEVIEAAVAQGDDLNIVPETFRPAMKARRRHVRPSALQPSSDVEGRFAPAEPAPGALLEKEMVSPTPSEPKTGQHRRNCENESLDMSDSEGISIHTPRRLSSISGDGNNVAQENRSGHQRPHTMAWEGSRHITRADRLVRSTTTPGLRSQQPSSTFDGNKDRPVPGITAEGHSAQPRDRGRLASHNSTSETGVPTIDRSPLGRISPLTAENLEANARSLLGSGRGEAECVREASSEQGRHRLSKRGEHRRSRSPGAMV